MLVVVSLALSVPALATDATNGLPTGTVEDFGVTLYDGPWDNANVVGTLPSGTPVIILQFRGDWMQVFARAERLVGWVVPNAPIKVDYSSPIFPGIVISQNVSLREAPSTGAKRIASVPNGALFDLLDEQNGWYRVSYFETKTSTYMEGWVLVDYVVRDPSFVTTTKTTYVYATPDRGAKKVGQLAEGSQLVVIGEWGDFWVVNLRSASGFIYKRDIEENQIDSGNG